MLLGTSPLWASAGMLLVLQPAPTSLLPHHAWLKHLGIVSRYFGAGQRATICTSTGPTAGHGRVQLSFGKSVQLGQAMCLPQRSHAVTDAISVGEGFLTPESWP